MLPNFLIIGAQKSGSTFLVKCLREHPDIFMPLGEIRIFENPEYQQTNVHQFFEELLGDVYGKKAIGIKRPAYLAKPECPERIYEHIPNAKLVAILRNPIERAISAYFHYMKCGFIPIEHLEKGMTKLIEGEYERLYPKSAEIIDYGLYHRYLARYLNYFERNQILVLLFDALKVNPLESIRQVYRFLGVRDDYVPRGLSMKNQQNPGVYSLPRLRLLNVRNPLMYTYNEDRTKRYPKQPKRLGKLANKMIIWTDAHLFAPICGDFKPELKAAQKRKLFEIYEEDIYRLEDFLGQELLSWKLSEQPVISLTS
jgi:Sulfotransferase domain